MEKVDINKILNRQHIEDSIINILLKFDENKNDTSAKNGIYIYGNPGSGKTAFVMNLLKKMNYDIIKFDAGDIRNTSVIDDITKHNMSTQNVLSMFSKTVKKKVIVMDEIDGMNNGDKGGINSLIKLIRPKKTKKQKREHFSLNPIICISNYKFDKKIKELVKVCNSFELKTPTDIQIKEIIKCIIPSTEYTEKINYYVQGDLRRLNIITNILNNDANFFRNDGYIELKNYNEDTKNTTNVLFNTPFEISQHSELINETDRTSVALLWHENIIDLIEHLPKSESIPFYLSQLKNICFSDYIDRITFQNQIWQFNEMSSLVKTFYNNFLFHSFYKGKNKKSLSEVRFTKVLTKYSTEFNNSQFMQKLCQKLNFDKNDVIGYFYNLKNNISEQDIIDLLDNYEISKLDINRIYRYIGKYTDENASGTADKIIDNSDDESDSL